MMRLPAQGRLPSPALCHIDDDLWENWPACQVCGSAMVPEEPISRKDPFSFRLSGLHAAGQVQMFVCLTCLMRDRLMPNGLFFDDRDAFREGC